MSSVFTKKNLIMSLLIIVLVVILLLGIKFFLKNDNKKENNVNMNNYYFDNVSSKKEIGKLKQKKEKRSNIYYKIDYPLVGNDKIDKNIEEQVNKLIEDNDDKYLANTDNVTNYYFLDYETYVGVDNVLSVVFKEVVEASDLKLLSNKVYSYSYDLKNSKVLQKSDIFKDNYLEKLKKYDDSLNEDFNFVIKNDKLILIDVNKEVLLSDIKDYVKLDLENVNDYSNDKKEVNYEIVNEQYKVIGETVLYDKDSLDGKVIEKLTKDSIVDVYSIGDNKWSVIFYKGQLGYVESKNLEKYVKITDVVKDESENIDKSKETVYAITDVNIRNEAKMDSVIIGVLKSGDSIVKTGVIGTWTQVIYNGSVAYISSSCLTNVKVERRTVKLNVSPQGDIDKNKPMVALTFDDGPGGASTNKILDILEKYNVKATFFDLGTRMLTYPETVKREEKLGEVGTHTYSHKDLNRLSLEGINQELALSKDAFVKVLGHEPILLRPPYGNASATVKAVVNMPIINWSVDSLDWKYRNKDLILNEIDKYGDLNGKIILMHSIYNSTADAVEILVPDLLDKGYQIVTVSEMAVYKGYILETGVTYHNFK